MSESVAEYIQGLRTDAVLRLERASRVGDRTQIACLRTAVNDLDGMTAALELGLKDVALAHYGRARAAYEDATREQQP